MCIYVRLSGGNHGFHYMDYSQAVDAAKELGAVKEVTTSTHRRFGGRDVVSISYFDENNEEVFNYQKLIDAGQVFDPPRKVAEEYLYDRVI